MKALADDPTIVIKKADKGSCVVMWDRTNYLLEAENEFNDTSIYKSIEFKEKVLADLPESSNKMFWDLKTKGG